MQTLLHRLTNLRPSYHTLFKTSQPMSFKFIRITRQKSQQYAKNMSTSRVKHPSFEYPMSFSRKKDNSTHMRPLLNYWIEMRTEESRQIVQERERECLSSKYSADSHTWLNLSQFGAHWKRGLHGKRMRCAFPTILYNCFERNLSHTQSNTLLPSHTHTHMCVAGKVEHPHVDDFKHLSSM